MTDGLHHDRTADVPVGDIAATASTWLAKLGPDRVGLWWHLGRHRSSGRSRPSSPLRTRRTPHCLERGRIRVQVSRGTQRSSALVPPKTGRVRCFSPQGRSRICAAGEDEALATLRGALTPIEDNADPDGDPQTTAELVHEAALPTLAELSARFAMVVVGSRGPAPHRRPPTPRMRGRWSALIGRHRPGPPRALPGRSDRRRRTLLASATPNYPYSPASTIRLPPS